MTDWTERSGPPATSWVERSGPPATSWTERSTPSAASFLEGPIKFRKDSLNFYVGDRGFLGGLVPKKDAENFYDLAGEAYPGSYFAGKTSGNFVEVAPR